MRFPIKSLLHATIALVISSLMLISAWLLLMSPVLAMRNLEIKDWRVFFPIEITGEAVWAKLPSLDAADFPILRVNIEGRTAGTNVAVLWRTKDYPTKINQYLLPWAIGSVSALNLSSIRQWHGPILDIGIAVGGRATGPVRIRSFKLQSWSALEQLQLLWTLATSFEGFKAYTINFIYGGMPSNNYISATVIIAAWIVLASVLMFIWQIFMEKQLTFVTFYLIIIIGWLILDFRWQLELIRQRELTVYEYAGQTIAAKRSNGKDGALFRFIAAIKDLLPKSSQRILLIPSDRDREHATLMRASFYLRPHNVYAIDTMPLCQKKLQAGDYVLSLGTSNLLNFVNNRLLWEGCNLFIGYNNTGLIVDRIAATAVGQLFLIKTINYTK